MKKSFVLISFRPEFFSGFKSVRQDMIQLKSLILLKLGTNVGFGGK